MQFERKQLTDEQLVDFYKTLLLPRLIEEKMLLLLRQGRISKWFSGIGQEAISVGVALALEADEWIMPLHRNLGVFTTRKMPLHKLFRQWQGSKDGYSKGRERSFHFGSKEHFICGMISHLGPQLAIADGVALAYKLRHEEKVSLAFTGDGGTSEGDFHEALNTAAVWDLPVIFVIENNGYGLSTPVNEQYRCKSLVDRAYGYGIEGVSIDGNNLLKVYDTIKGVRDYCIKKQKPYLVECNTFRMRGHEEASGVKYVPEELFQEWAKKDPINMYEKYLLFTGILEDNEIEKIHQQINGYVSDELKLSFDGEAISVDSNEEMADVFAQVSDLNRNNTKHFNPQLNSVDEAEEINLGRKQETQYADDDAGIWSEQDDETDAEVSVAFLDTNVLEQTETGKNLSTLGSVENSARKEPNKLRFIDAIRQGLHQSMKRHSNLILMGQDIAEYGGAFKITEGFVEEFGKDRVRNTPLCESAIVGAALGLSLEGFKSVVEMQFSDFVTMAFNQIVNNLAKIHYRWGQHADVVIRMPAGGSVGAGPFHSQTNESWFFHTPGLKIVYPSTSHDAKGLLIAAINDPNPVLFFEHKALYRSISGEVNDDYYEVELGKARHVREGFDLSIITYGLGVIWAEDFAASHSDISIDILDLRSLIPLDYDSITNTVKQTGKVLVLHEASLTGGVGAEIAAWISENCFQWLDAPVMRCASLDTPIPFADSLEKNYLANSRLPEMVDRLLSY